MLEGARPIRSNPPNEDESVMSIKLPNGDEWVSIDEADLREAQAYDGITGAPVGLYGRISSGVVYANIHPDVLARLERIESMLTQLTSLPHNKRHDAQPLAEQPK